MAGLLASAAIVALAFALVPSGTPNTGGPDPVAVSINNLPATAAGLPASVAPAQASGILASGRVAKVYVRAAEGAFVEVGRAPERLESGAQRWVEVEFPDPVGGISGPALALLGEAGNEVGAGDIVDVRFAQTRDLRAATEHEGARVTGLVERRDSALARDFERRISARGEPAARAKLP
jgi:hypothetical protein